MLKNRFRFVTRDDNNNSNNNNNNNDAASSSSSSLNDDDDTSSLKSLLELAGDSEEENYPYEELIADANQHAEEAKQQRALARLRQQTAMEEADQPHEHRRFVFYPSFD
jgi:hypothetical protein